VVWSKKFGFCDGNSANAVCDGRIFAVFSLTVMRILTVYFALRSMRLNAHTILFLGWFGPRGLASILFVLLVLGDTLLPHPEIVTNIVFVAVMISVFAHGLSAAPLALSYGNSQYAAPLTTGVQKTTESIHFHTLGKNYEQSSDR
jgi:NhaP-type Na+/H+ or K+/H+ antiporter